jgi:pyruvate,orthophosphate dikinase
VGNDTARLPRVLPQLGPELRRLKAVLETEFKDLQDFEFTVEEGRLFILQTRSGRRSPWAALQIAVDMVRQRLITPEEALERLQGVALQDLARLALVPDPGADEIATAIPANAGVAVGKVALDPQRALEMAQEGEAPILVRDDIVTDDIAGLAAAEGLLTARGSRTSHAAVVAREMGKVCLVACPDLRIDLRRRSIRIGTRQLVEGDDLSLDGDTGRIYAGKAGVRRLVPTEALAEVAAWRRAAAGHSTSV